MGVSNRCAGGENQHRLHKCISIPRASGEDGCAALATCPAELVSIPGTSQFTSKGSLVPLQRLIVLEPKAELMMTLVRSPLKSLQVPTGAPPSGDFVSHVSGFRGEQEDDTEPDLDAIAASFTDDQPDPPHAGSVDAESIVDQEVSRIQPNTQNVYLDCSGLKGSQLF